MTTRKSTQFLVAAAALFVTTGLAAARQASTGAQRPAAATTQIPVDPQVTTRRFENGLQYYIRENKRPEKRADLRLVIDVGSIMEDHDQLGLAHFVEHISFNGTKNFPKQGTVKFLESIGDAVRAERERVHQLRRDGLHPAGSDRQFGRPREVRPDSP